jgi:ethanolamine utilization cobalamin adenosyltransferase
MTPDISLDISPETLTAFFGWMTVLNIGFLAVTSLLLMAFRDQLAALHAAILGLDQVEVKKGYFSYLANYKILIFVTSLMPYLALKLM